MIYRYFFFGVIACCCFVSPSTGLFAQQPAFPGKNSVGRLSESSFTKNSSRLGESCNSFPGQNWSAASPQDVNLDAALLAKARDYALTGEGSGYITRHGKLVLSWGDVKKRYDLKSTTKSIGVTALGLAIADGKVRLEDKAQQHHPKFGVPPDENAKTGWLPKVTLLHLATQTAGFDKRGDYQPLLFEPGTKWAYSDGGPNWLAECLTLKYRRDLQDLMFERVFRPLGIKPANLRWRNNSYRPHRIDGIPRREFGSGIHANVDAMARIGYLYLRQGKWNDRQILPREFVQACRATPSWLKGLPVVKPQDYGKASDHYGLLWWNNSDDSLKGVPRDAYWSWGLYDSLIVVIPSLDIVVSRAGKSWKRSWSGHYDVLAPFLRPIVAAASAPIRGVKWAPKNEIIRLAKGSDNWPLTWADDDALYGAYGDGWGFKPRAPRKLSLGLAKILGDPSNIRGVNIPSPTGEQIGDGPRGKKASGMLMVDGVLYMLVRNANNSQLAWSTDRGRTWSFSDWKFTKSFGCPTFLNFGKNYAGARDKYVYIYSPETNTAYKAADQMVLARVLQTEIRNRKAYEFYAGVDEAGAPRWTSDITRRQAVLERPGRCYRGGVSYNATLGRYLWVILPGGDTRFEGGLAIYSSRRPWGKWAPIFETDNWDVGPGETASIPSKWISADGKSFYLVFSGEDAFSLRRGWFVLEH